ncbi:hypothetical protein [Caldicellulosiruptor morganii]|uniref:Uncharacterized protein n=1 Tax=Caldicellulosiruptor morganii TaxID=1387555 RepID=A0ABY7BPL7_9FIRM|nr:hypothetical protein [Caldicellulosiruptor morganii]WAM33720.1 hypothetical protein OTK00_002254 [Caldicellulosiruptor morganii]
MRVKKSAGNKKWILGFVIGLIFGLAAGFAAGYYVSLHKEVKHQEPSLQQQAALSGGQTSGNLPQTSGSVYEPSQESRNAENVETFKAYGRFAGEIDSHSIEVNLLNTDFDYKTFEVDVQNLQNFNLKPGQIVEIDFEKPEDGGNPRIVNLSTPDEVTLKGKYIGLADNNFAEFLFDSKHVVLQISDVLDRISYLDENTDVEVTFKTNSRDPNSNPTVIGIKVLK